MTDSTSPPDRPEFRRKRIWRIGALAATVALGCSLAVALFDWSATTGPDRREIPGEEPPLVSDDAFQDPVFSGPAFSPEATVEDMKQEAIRSAEELLQTYPDATDAIGVAARLRSRLGDTDVAASLWQRCVELDPRSAEAYFHRGQIAEDNGDAVQAADMFGQAAALAPEDPTVGAKHADALMKCGRVDEAIAVLERQIRGRAVLDKALLTLGLAYLQTNQFEKAKRTFEDLIRADPTEARAYYGLARSLTRLGQMEAAERSLEKFRNLGSVDHEELARANRDFEDVAMVRGLLVDTLAACGQVYQRRGSAAKAEECWQKTASLDPENLPSRYGLLRLYEVAGRDRDALRICEHLCRVQSENPDHWLFAGLLYYRLGRTDTARSALQRATQLEPDNPKYQQAYAMVSSEE